MSRNTWINDTSIGKALINKGYGIMQLCGVLDMPYGKLVKKLTNPRLCTVAELERIAKATGMPMEEVIHRAKEM